MKRFIYVERKVTISRTYGGSNVVADAYRVQNNRLIYLCDARWCTRSYRGSVHEAMNAIIDNTKGQIAKKWRGYYDRNNKAFRIRKL